jgi:hypothetical protein
MRRTRIERVFRRGNGWTGLILGIGLVSFWSACNGSGGYGPVRAPVSRVRADLRSMATAIESYKLDHDALPMAAWQLTTPTPFLKALLADVFDPETPLRYRAVGSGYLIWSVGPDGVDDAGEIRYDPTNGTHSRGDVVRLSADLLASREAIVGRR